jgi:hypothetical protein
MKTYKGNPFDKPQNGNDFIADVSSSNYYWMINQNTYTIDGIEVKQGRMEKIKKGSRPIINPDWRKATNEEVETKQWYKGNFFNLRAWR